MFYSVHSYKSSSAIHLYNLLARTFSQQITQEIACIQIWPEFKVSLHVFYSTLHLYYFSIDGRLCWLGLSWMRFEPNIESNDHPMMIEGEYEFISPLRDM